MQNITKNTSEKFAPAFELKLPFGISVAAKGALGIIGSVLFILVLMCRTEAVQFKEDLPTVACFVKISLQLQGIRPLSAA